MAFDSVVYLISGGTNYYLSGSTVNRYTGSGTPWTAEATSPYRLSLNDGTPIWVPTQTPAAPIWGGGPPFRNGQALIYRTFPNQTESVGIQMYANSADNAAALLRQLRQILNTALYSVPCILAIQTGTNTAYYEIYTADVQEITSYLTLGSSTVHEVRATITWTRSFAGGRLSSGETLINGATFTNTGTGANNNTQAFSTGAGDFIYDGSPLNLAITKGSTINATKYYMASVKTRTYTADGASYSTTLDGELKASITFSGADFASNAALKPRIMIRVASATSNLRLRYNIAYSTSVVNTFADSPWVYPTDSGSGTTLLDMGTFEPSFLRRTRGGTGSIVVRILYSSTDGGSASATLSYVELLSYYTFCTVATNVSVTSTVGQYMDTFMERSNRPALPLDYPISYGATASTGALLGNNTIRGTAPKYYSGASLYLGWTVGGAHSTSETFTVSATHAPLYHTLRGNS
jgi:hypothetical protein